MAPMGTTITEGYPPECAAIKALFHQQSFRKCISTCRSLLKLNGGELDQRPLHKTFVLFYLALCHDEMARVMHHASVTKIPSFESAEQFYADALAALPTEEECRTIWEMRNRRAQEVAFVDEDRQSEWGASSSLADEEDCFDDREVRSTAPHLAFVSSAPTIRSESFSARSSPQLSAADTDDLESHESFSELMTPNRVVKRDTFKAAPPETVPPWKQPYSIPRDYSRMSLVEAASPPIVQGLPREYSRMSLVDCNRPARPATPESRSLMRPVRLGSPPKPYAPPPIYTSTAMPKTLTCKIPQRIQPCNKDDWTPRPPSPELVSPVSASPVRDSPVSVISAECLPVLPPRIDTPVFFEPEKPFDEQGLLRFTEHVAAMRIQLNTHVMLIHHAKRQLERLLENKAAARTPPKSSSLPATPPRKNKDTAGNAKPRSSPGGQLQRAPSFWSFVPADAKKAELQRRIKAGREKKWARTRFSPERYQHLCEVALEEL